MRETKTAPAERAGRWRSGGRVRVTIERLVFQGDGLSRLPDGRVIFVPMTAPGDEVEVRVEEDRRDFVRGTAVRTLAPSPIRTEPRCGYFGICGGCQWQHVAYPAQLDWKRRILEELLARVGKLGGVPVATPIAPLTSWEYRAQAQLTVIGGARPCVGFHRRETNRVVNIDRCPLLDPRLNTLLRAMRHMKHPSFFSLFPGVREAWVALGTGTGELLLSLFGRVQDRGALRLLFHTLRSAAPGLQGVASLEGGLRRAPRVVDWYGARALHEQIGDARFRVGATSFFQVSGLAAAGLTSLVLEGAALTGTERVLELYSGVGTFSVPLAKRARELVGIEANTGAAADADENLRQNGCAGARIVQAQVEQGLPGAAAEGTWDAVVLDPPRQGCSRAVLDLLASMRAARLVYVSCDPSTLARDLAALVGAGYRCTSLQPIDLFPQTFHLECVAVLTR